MAKDTPERFAKLVFSELADIHAIAKNLHDYMIADVAIRNAKKASSVSAEMNKRRRERARKIYQTLLARIDLSSKSHP